MQQCHTCMQNKGCQFHLGKYRSWVLTLLPCHRSHSFRKKTRGSTRGKGLFEDLGYQWAHTGKIPSTSIALIKPTKDNVGLQPFCCWEHPQRLLFPEPSFILTSPTKSCKPGLLISNIWCSTTKDSPAYSSVQ